MKKLGLNIHKENHTTHYFSSKPKETLFLLALGLLPYFDNVKINLSTKHPFGFSVHKENDTVKEITVSPILYSFLKNYRSGANLGQDCIKEVINYFK
jgi:hypothetical protein